MTSVFSAEGRNTSVVSPKAIVADPLVSAKTRLDLPNSRSLRRYHLRRKSCCRATPRQLLSRCSDRGMKEVIEEQHSVWRRLHRRIQIWVQTVYLAPDAEPSNGGKADIDRQGTGCPPAAVAVPAPSLSRRWLELEQTATRLQPRSQGCLLEPGHWGCWQAPEQVRRR